jgi:acyl-CoA reductase-like NAD-dependent aldehyde dehydrogenase
MRRPVAAFERAEVLTRIGAALEARREEAARLICAEAGKPIKAARVEAGRAVATFSAAAVEARVLAGEVVPMEGFPAGAGKLGFTLRVPVGVVGAISPFNFPLNLVAHKLAPAFAAGCAVVLKPADKTPLSALFLSGLAAEAGLPAGWLSVVVGPPAEIGDVLVEDARVAALTFTGSAPVGWGLRARAPRKRVLLELGNSTPVIVAADADLDRAASTLAANAFSFAGQSCISVQRIYVERAARDAFVERFLPAVEALVVGDPADEATDVGPVVTADARERILAWIGRSGGTILTGGDTTDEGLVRPTVIADPRPDAEVVCDEVFGPVCVVESYDGLDDALARANGTRYGLQASIFTRDLGRALEAVRGLEFGAVLVNEAPTFRTDQMPYGGVKESGNTREGPRYAVREFTEERLVVLELPRREG